jgi:2-polyprenyl-3-methyl-5-hydroxy-6-metoxy-1,4-benzoquinol methylase
MKPETTNFEKFNTGNPIVRRLINNFFEKISDKFTAEPVDHLLDAGCGEGMTLYQMRNHLPTRVTGFDINPDCVAYTKEMFPQANITVEDVFNLPYQDKAFDLVICLEVFEHLPNPELALKALKHVASKRLILSVPHEPWFQLGSFCRGKYLKSWGNHPEHINHWSPGSFETFLKQEFTDVSIDTSLPWIIAEIKV